jgi:peptidoglycan/xylan/chitin deacetylase (PgdA/CDA1 family)
MPPELFRQRMAAIKRNGLRVLSLSEGVQALYNETLEQPSLVITFDDGYQDYFQYAAPILEEFSFPATVYLSTWYVDRPYPAFNIFCSYVLWLSIGSRVRLGKEFGFLEPPSLLTASAAEDAALKIVAFMIREGFTGDQKDELARRLAEQLGIDYEKILRSRVLGLMTTKEIRALNSLTSIELHTHRHRAPADEHLFRREIIDNRIRIEEITGRRPTHFCYPSGQYYAECLPWLAEEGVATATTCVSALASPDSNIRLLPRMLDGANITAVEFDAWLSGFEPRVRGLR